MAESESLIALLRADGFDVTEWFDDPGTSYPEHVHAYREARVVLEGQITFAVGAQTLVLGPGDRIDFAAGEAHTAVVGPDGARYLAGTAR